MPSIDFYSAHLETLAELQALATKHNCKLSFGVRNHPMQLDDIDKELQVLEIIKKYPRCTLQRYIGFIDAVKQGYITKWEELTQELLYNYDFDCSVEEFNVIKEWLNKSWQF